MLNQFFKTLLFVTLFSLFLTAQQKKQADDTPLYKKNPNYDQYLSLFDMYKIKKADIVFLGNSITEGGNWPELLGIKGIANRGIPGDILEGFLARIDGVTKLRPDICIIMGGINDIYAWIPVEDVYKNYLKLLRKLKRKNIKPIVISTLYAGENYHSSKERNTQVKILNTKLFKYCKKYKIKFLDLNKLLSRNEFLKQSVTIDGIHLNWKGYKAWAAELNKELKKYGYK